jgi:hypothetical protein
MFGLNWTATVMLQHRVLAGGRMNKFQGRMFKVTVVNRWRENNSMTLNYCFLHLTA